MKPAALIMLLFFTGCKTSSIYPAAGATLGGAAGSFAGPIAGGASALAGYSAGKAAQLASTHKTTLKALSQGDVSALVQQGLVQAKEQGFFSHIKEEIISILQVAALALLLFNLIPLIYTRWLHGQHKKTKAKNETI